MGLSWIEVFWFVLGFLLAVFVLNGYARIKAFFLARKMKEDWRRKSVDVAKGKVFETFVPFRDFPFHPRDARFIGDPIDFIVFDGLYEGREKINIYFVEAKSGGRMNRNEKKVEEAVKKKRVFFKLVQ